MKLSIVKSVFCTLFFVCVISLKAQTPEGKAIFPNWINNLELSGEDTPQSMIKKVDVKGQSFKKALHVNTFGRSLKGECGLSGKINSALSKGDVIWVSVIARNIESRRETGEAFIEFRINQLIDGENVWPPHLERGISFGSEWTEMSMPFVMSKDARPEDLQVFIRFDTYPQQFEIGSITILNCGQNIRMSDLPRTTVRYEGDESDASWRREAADRIEKYRKGDLNIKVVDAAGNPVPDAKIKVEMKRSAFHWGTAINSRNILDDTREDLKIYRDTLLKYFNMVAFENEMKPKIWARQKDEERGANALLAFRWLRKHNLPVRAQVLVWPSWQHSPHLEQYKDDPEKLRQAILDDIDIQTNYMHGQFAQWDVINEPYAHHDILDILGREEMVRWFKYTHERAPGVKLVLNDYTMFQGEGGPGSPSECFYDNARFLLEKGAPVDIIGEQAHIGGTPPGISKLLERLNRFAELGLPVLITEFDINSNDDEFKARYMRDFLTVMFSHPSVEGVLQWGFWEGQHWFPVAALWNKDWTIRAHGAVFTDLVTNKWRSHFDGKTGKEGVFNNRGFCGEYEVSVEYNEQTIQEKINLANQGLELILKME